MSKKPPKTPRYETKFRELLDELDTDETHTQYLIVKGMQHLAAELHELNQAASDILQALLALQDKESPERS